MFQKHWKEDIPMNISDIIKQAREELGMTWADTVLRVAYTWTGNPQDAQDVCQTVLLKLLTCPERFPDLERRRSIAAS